MKKTALLFVFLLGIMTVTGFAQDKDASEYMALAEKGDADAQFNLGRCYAKEENYTEAVKWYMKAAKQNHADAQWRLGNYYYNGWAEPEVPQDYAEAAKWYRKAAEQNHADAQCNLGICYEYGYGVPQNYEEAVKWYIKAAEQGIANAQNNLGVCYYWGYGVPQDYEEAVKWYIKAAEKEFAEAQNNLGVCYHHGNGVQQDYAEAFKWYRKAAENGSTIAMINIGDMYRDGNSYEDYKKAESYYMKAVNKGSSDAMIKMGDLYLYNYDDFNDFEDKSWQDCFSKAITWYKLAIEQNNPDGITSLARLFDEYYLELGDKLTIDGVFHEYNSLNDVYPYAKDTLRPCVDELWLSAAQKGSAEAQAVIGFKKFVEKNFDEAMEWYIKAKENGATCVYRRINVILPIDIAIMLCDHFKKHSFEYDFYFADKKPDLDLFSNHFNGWQIYVFPGTGWSDVSYYDQSSDHIYVTVTKNDKFGLIKLSKDGKLLEKTPIIYDSYFYYYDDDENDKFHTELNGQDVKFDL